MQFTCKRPNSFVLKKRSGYDIDLNRTSFSKRDLLGYGNISTKKATLGTVITRNGANTSLFERGLSSQRILKRNSGIGLVLKDFAPLSCTSWTHVAVVQKTFSNVRQMSKSNKQENLPVQKLWATFKKLLKTYRRPLIIVGIIGGLIIGWPVVKFLLKWSIILGITTYVGYRIFRFWRMQKLSYLVDELVQIMNDEKRAKIVADHMGTSQRFILANPPQLTRVRFFFQRDPKRNTPMAGLDHVYDHMGSMALLRVYAPFINGKWQISEVRMKAFNPNLDSEEVQPEVIVFNKFSEPEIEVIATPINQQESSQESSPPRIQEAEIISEKKNEDKK